MLKCSSVDVSDGQAMLSRTIVIRATPAVYFYEVFFFHSDFFSKRSLREHAPRRIVFRSQVRVRVSRKYNSMSNADRPSAINTSTTARIHTRIANMNVFIYFLTDHDCGPLISNPTVCSRMNAIFSSRVIVRSRLNKRWKTLNTTRYVSGLKKKIKNKSFGTRWYCCVKTMANEHVRYYNITK
jgi:hypothetical protein